LIAFSLLILASCSLDPAQEFNQSVTERLSDTYSRLCFLYVDGEQRFYFDEGNIYSGEKLLGHTRNGCVYPKSDECNGENFLVFQPDSIKLYGYNMTSSKKVDSCDDANIVVSEKQFDHFSRLKWSVPYIKNIDLSDPGLKQAALSITENCTDDTCRVNAIYRHVMTSLKYIRDNPDGGDQIYSPATTLKRGGGDCEDLSGVMNSYLGAIGIKTFVVLTEKHAYALACGVDMKRLQEEVLKSFYETTEVSKEQDIELVSGRVYYYGGTSASVAGDVEFSFSVEADSKVDVYVVKSQKDYIDYVETGNFGYYKECSEKYVTSINRTCNIADSGGIMIVNKAFKPIKVKLVAKYKYDHYIVDPAEVVMDYYTVDNETCVVLEATAGKFGYPGYSVDDKTMKMAIDPSSFRIVNLT